MRSLEDRLDITFHNRERLSYREVARRLGGNRRTVRKHAEHPARYDRRRRSVPRAILSDVHRDQNARRLAECPQRRPKVCDIPGTRNPGPGAIRALTGACG
jgi:hypothetical protein